MSQQRRKLLAVNGAIPQLGLCYDSSFAQGIFKNILRSGEVAVKHHIRPDWKTFYALPWLIEARSADFAKYLTMKLVKSFA